MSQLTLEIPDDVAKRYDEIADKLNVSRAKSGQAPITSVAVMQIVLARFAGLPVDEDVDLSSVSSLPHGSGQADLMISTRPHPG